MTNIYLLSSAAMLILYGIAGLCASFEERAGTAGVLSCLTLVLGFSGVGFFFCNLAA